MFVSQPPVLYRLEPLATEKRVDPLELYGLGEAS